MSAITSFHLPTRARALRRDDDGMATAEYAVGTVAACGMAGVLYQVITSDAITGLLGNLLEKALSWVF